MTNSVEKILYRKSALIFEELGFLMPGSNTKENARTDSTSAIVPFRGPFSGCLLVSLSSTLLPLLSANMLGEQACSNKEWEQDSLREISNVICGNVLPAIYGFERIFQLDVPRLLDNPDPLLRGSEYRTEAHAHIFFDSGQAAVTLLVESKAFASSIG